MENVYNVKFCPVCNETGINAKLCIHEKGQKFVRGYHWVFSEVDPEDKICPYCKRGELVDSGLDSNEFEIIADSTNYNRQVLEAMIALKQKDPIEYQLKLNQLKLQVTQQEALKKQEENKIRCPKCKSTNVTIGERGFSVFWGFLGSNKTMNRCGKCGYKWTPKK